MESSHRDLLNDMAEHWYISKNNQNTHYYFIFQGRPIFSHINGKLSPRPFHPRFGLTPKTGAAFPKTGFCFYFKRTKKSHFIYALDGTRRT